MHLLLKTKPPLRDAVSSDESPSSATARMTLDGKFFKRSGQRVRLHGVTYGPFQPHDNVHHFPARNIVAGDLASMAAIGVNAIRTYHVPPQWLLEAAECSQLGVLIDVPWSKHVCFLDSAVARREARDNVRKAVEQNSQHSCVLAHSIGNEIPPDIVRWHGARRVERFIAELADVARQADPAGLVTFANYPPTEYLDLSFLDFLTFNVYLHDRETFRRYLLRLQNLIGSKPLVLGEIGMDTIRHGEVAQADFLSGHFTEAMQAGLAGAFVFSWTDEWFTGQHSIDNWQFGITRRDRTPKPAFHALRETFEDPLERQLPSGAPRVSVVVCSYNGGATLDQCLRSLAALKYPDYEVILVDDGSTDDTRAIIARFPWIRSFHTTNQGLSAARNTGLRAATGSIMAYTDSDCFVDPDWLTQLVFQLEHNDAAAVGGPNLAPPDGRVAACVGAAPGQPTHVLETDQVAEHIPGCNMAFRRAALEAINGFDPQYRKAGDDVDVCWRLQQSGRWITFAPGGFVWHHRRQTPRAFLRQQAGYGEAEALLRFKHPDRFNGRGHGKWRGVLYGNSLQGLVLGDAIIYRGTFGTGPFQCIYQPGPAHWAMLPSALEWQTIALLIAVPGIWWWPALVCAAGMIAVSILVAGLQAAQAQFEPKYRTLGSRLLVMGLCYAQPLVRSWARYKTRYFSRRGAARPGNSLRTKSSGWHVARTSTYWGERGQERVDLLHRVLNKLSQQQCAKTIDTGWRSSDVEVDCGPWSTIHLRTVQEDHGAQRRLIRVRSYLKFSSLSQLVCISAGVAALVSSSYSLSIAGSWLLATTVVLLAIIRDGARGISGIHKIVHQSAFELDLLVHDARAQQGQS